MTNNFKEWINEDEACTGYVLSALMFEVSTWLNEGRVNEGRVNRRQLAGMDFTPKKRGDPNLFGDEEVGADPEKKIDKFIDAEGGPRIWTPKFVPSQWNSGTPDLRGGKDKDSCEITPLSSYANDIGAIQAFAKSSPANFAQVLMFAPLSANVPFAKHWDNFYMLMAILKHQFPERVTRQEIEHAVDSFGDKYYALAHTIGGFKLDTVVEIWSNKENLFHELNALANAGDDVKLMKRLNMFPGIQSVKAGFVIQLLWGRAGCIDTHNIDIYSKVFPDMDKAGDFDEKEWSRKKGGAEKYFKMLDKLKDRGIGTQELWDVWVDFVETMYVMVTHHGMGYYDMQGAALDKDDPKYDVMKGVKIPKLGIGKDRGGVMVPLAGGKLGMGASATHSLMAPDDALKQFYNLYSRGGIQKPASLVTDPQELAARAVNFRKGPDGRPLNQNLGSQPTALHYLSPAIGAGGQVDPDRIRSIIQQRMELGGKKARKRRVAARQRSLFGAA